MYKTKQRTDVKDGVEIENDHIDYVLCTDDVSVYTVTSGFDV